MLIGPVINISWEILQLSQAGLCGTLDFVCAIRVKTYYRKILVRLIGAVIIMRVVHIRWRNFLVQQKASLHHFIFDGVWIHNFFISSVRGYLIEEIIRCQHVTVRANKPQSIAIVCLLLNIRRIPNIMIEPI